MTLIDNTGVIASFGHLIGRGGRAGAYLGSAAGDTRDSITTLPLPLANCLKGFVTYSQAKLIPPHRSLSPIRPYHNERRKLKKKTDRGILRPCMLKYQRLILTKMLTLWCVVVKGGGTLIQIFLNFAPKSY